MLQQSLKPIDIELREQQQEGRVRWQLGGVGAEQLVEGHAVAFGKTLHPEQRTLVGKNGQDRHQQHPPLRVANPPAQTAIRKHLEKLIKSFTADGLSIGETKGFGRDLRTKPELTAARQGYWDRLLMDPVENPAG